MPGGVRSKTILREELGNLVGMMGFDLHISICVVIVVVYKCMNNVVLSDAKIHKGILES